MARSFAVVKASYTKSGSEAKASIRYMQHRQSDQGERHPRQLFGSEGELSRAEAYERLDRAEQEQEKVYFYRVVLNAGEGHADLSEDARQDWAREVMARIETRGVKVHDWVGVSHTDQGEHDHVHVVAATSRTLQKDELADLRTYSREAYDQQRDVQHQRGVYHDDADTRGLAKQHELERNYEQDQRRQYDMGMDY